jgi:hypothetical protein
MEASVSFFVVAALDAVTGSLGQTTISVIGVFMIRKQMLPFTAGYRPNSMSASGSDVSIKFKLS